MSITHTQGSDPYPADWDADEDIVTALAKLDEQDTATGPVPTFTPVTVPPLPRRTREGMAARWEGIPMPQPVAAALAGMQGERLPIHDAVAAGMEIPPAGLDAVFGVLKTRPDLLADALGLACQWYADPTDGDTGKAVLFAQLHEAVGPAAAAACSFADTKALTARVLAALRLFEAAERVEAAETPEQVLAVVDAEGADL